MTHWPLSKFTILKPFYISIGESLARHETRGQGETGDKKHVRTMDNIVLHEQPSQFLIELYDNDNPAD